MEDLDGIFNFPNYKILQKIGEGSFASVYKGVHKLSQQIVAVKIFSKSKLQTSQKLQLLRQEMLVALSVHHPLLSSVLDVTEDSDHIAMVMEYLEGGTLFQMIKTHGSLPISMVQQILQQIVFAVEYLHNVLRIVHRDLKAENILLDRYYNVRLVDFGLARRYDTERMLKTICGSPAYVAPEVLSGQPYTESVDVWSIGIVIYSCIRGRLPFYDENIVKLLQLVSKTDPEFPPDFPPIAADLVHHLLDRNPETRYTIPEIKEHPFFGNPISPYDNPLYSLIPNLPDPEILQVLQAQGIETHSIMENIKNHRNTNDVVAYKIARQYKITYLARDECQHKKIDSAKSDSGISNLLNCNIPSLKNSYQNVTISLTSSKHFRASNIQFKNIVNSQRSEDTSSHSIKPYPKIYHMKVCGSSRQQQSMSNHQFPLTQPTSSNPQPKSSLPPLVE